MLLDGAPLVVTTSNFKPMVFRSTSDRLTLTERFTRIDPDMIDYTIRVEDPVTYVAPFTLRLTVTRQPDYQLYEYSCHEGNGAVSYALAGERAYEKEVEAAKAKGLGIVAGTQRRHQQVAPRAELPSPLFQDGQRPRVEGCQCRMLRQGRRTDV